MATYAQELRALVSGRRLLLPGVRAVIVNDRNEVLLQRRTDGDCWGLPGGCVELDETALEALDREVLEETGLRVRRAEPMALYSGRRQRFSYPNGDQVQAFAVAFIVREWTGRPVADGIEGSQVRFWPVDGLPENLAAIHVGTLADFRRYRGQFLLSDGSDTE